MEKFDRSKFKGSKLSSIKETRNDAEKKNVPLLGGGGRISFHKVEEGRNEFRMMLAHLPESEPSYRPMRTTTLECELPEIKDGKETGKTVKQRRKIFIATQHGNEPVRKLGKDPVELYVGYIKEEAGAIDDKDDRSKFLSPVTGYRGAKGWIWGILPSTSYVCYALKDNKLGRLELWDKWVKELDKITASIEEEEKTVLEIDPFSDPDEGYPIVIKKFKNDKDKWEFTVERVNPSRKQTWDEFCDENMVTDDQIKELLSKESLTELYTDCYYDTDFDLAINGLRLFDKEHKFNIFENDEFLDQLEEIQKVVPVKEVTKEEDSKEESDDVIDISSWGKIKCKKYLRAFIAENYDGDEYDSYLEEIDILTLLKLREWCESAENKEILPKIEKVDNEPEEKSEEVSKGEDIKPSEDVEVEKITGKNTEQDQVDIIANRRRRRRQTD